MQLLARQQIFTKLFIVFMLAAMVPLLITWYVANNLTERNAQRLAETQLRIEGNQIAGRTDGWLALNYQSLIEHAMTPAIRSMKQELQRPVLISIAQHQPWTVLAYTLGLDGMSVARSDNQGQTSYADRAYFKTAIAGRPLSQQALFGRTQGVPLTSLAVPIADEGGRVVGVLVKGNALSEITDQLVNAKIGRTGRAMLISPEGKLLALTGMRAVKELKDYSKHPAFSDSTLRDSIIRYEDEGRKVVAWVGRTRFDWVVAVQMDQDEALEPVRENDRAMLALLAGALLIGALSALVIAPSIARPIRRLTRIAEEISHGRLEQEVTDTHRGDEIGSLARAVERLTISLRIAMNRLIRK